MSRSSQQLLYWIPRALGVAFAIFIGMFALDVFTADVPLTQQFVNLTIHLFPAYLIVIILALAWKWEWLGGVGFVALGLLYMWITELRFEPSVYALISGFAFLTGLFFLIDWMVRRKVHHSA